MMSTSAGSILVLLLSLRFEQSDRECLPFLCHEVVDRRVKLLPLLQSINSFLQVRNSQTKRSGKPTIKSSTSRASRESKSKLLMKLSLSVSSSIGISFRKFF